MNETQVSAPADGRRLRGDRARVQVLSQAVRLLSLEGLEGLTYGRVAEQAGTGKSNLQVLFGDREQLQRATLAHAIALYREQVVDPAMRKRTPLARLRALVLGWFDFVATRQLPGGCVITAVSSEFRARPGPLRDEIKRYREETRIRLREQIRDAKMQGQLMTDTDEVQLVVDLLAYQAFANVAALMDDEEEFARAKLSSIGRIKAATCSDAK